MFPKDCQESGILTTSYPSVSSALAGKWNFDKRMTFSSPDIIWKVEFRNSCTECGILPQHNLGLGLYFSGQDLGY